MDTSFRGAAKRLADEDLPRLGSQIGVGEDELHAIIDVESNGHGFDGQGRPVILFEPHVFYRNLSGAKRTQAVNAGLAYKSWGEKPYPKDSYPRLLAAIKIDETAALLAASWGLFQVLGENYKEAGYQTVQSMVLDFLDSEAAQLQATINFIKSTKLDKALRNHDWATFARGWNGSGYKKNAYDTKLAAAYAKWKKIKDTPWTPGTEPAPKPKPTIEPPAQPSSPPAAPPVAAPSETHPADRPVPSQPNSGALAAIIKLILSIFKR